jgi:rod shape determining protein RodA
MEKSPIRKIHKAFNSIFSGLDCQLGLILLGLAGVGFFTFLSASQNTPVLIEDELRNLALSFVVMWGVSRIPPKWLELAAVWIYSFGVALLIAVAAFGLIKKGARRWLNIGIVIQPSEIMKIAMPLMLAWYFQKREGIQKTWDYGIAAIILGIPVALIARQPDLGTALLVFAAGMYVIILAGLPWKWILPFVGLGAVGILLIIIFGSTICAHDVVWPLVHNYQKHRICTLLDPTTDPLGKGFHTIQSMIAIGSGGFFGKGWFQGTQAHLEFIPEKHTDFIFAVFAEEHGFFGATLLFGLFVTLVYMGLAIAKQGKDIFSSLLAIGMTGIIFVSFMINTSMVLGLFPVVGVPLPFFSYGGTALIMFCASLGILVGIERDSLDLFRKTAFFSIGSGSPTKS